MRDRYIIVTWPEIQDFQELDGFEDNSCLINDEKWIFDFGPSAYFIKEDWYETKCDKIYERNRS